MSMKINSTKKPSINIYFDENSLDESQFKQLMLGIEEEGIPYEVYGVQGNDAISLGYRACLESNLGVGLGVSRDNIVLHYNKLDEDCPIYNISLKSSAEKIRDLGSNAARLVIRMPFRGV